MIHWVLFFWAVLPLGAQPFDKLREFIDNESKQKQIPIIAAAIVDDQNVVWQYATGGANPQTVYRVGSVSKLFTDIAIMQFVEKKEVDLDVPVSQYLITFHPHSSADRSITLRQLMSHRSGLVREPPIGNYFDASPRTLEETVKSLNDTTLVYDPGRTTKYSNAGIAVVGRVLETLTRKPFADALRDAVLAPLGMVNSAFAPNGYTTANLAKAWMWTYDGRRFPAPQFELGMAPAGSLYTTLGDLGRFLSALFAQGKPIVQPATLDKMWEPQFSSGYGLGFRIGRLDGVRTVSHGGAIYGFATDLTAIPSEKLGVIVVSNLDSATAVSTHIAQQALRWMRSFKRGEELREPPVTTPLTAEEAANAAGRYGEGDKAVDLTARENHLYLTPLRGGERVELKHRGDELVTDDLLSYGEPFDSTLPRQPDSKPKPVPPEFLSYMGEYGWDHNVLYILEREGQLTALIEWYDYYPLTKVLPGVYRFPDFGLYQNELLTFTAEGARVGPVLFPKRAASTSGTVYRITPRQPVPELRKSALAATPPKETGNFRNSDLVELRTLDRNIRLDIRYATTDNFLSTPVYTQARAFMQRPAAEALVRAHQELAQQGYGLLIHDAYRPWFVTKIFWDATTGDQRSFVANPAQGSRHNRGCAVDLTMYDLKTKKPVEMTGLYDEMSTRSYPDYPGSTSLARWHRELLRAAMERQGFRINEVEWWHFDYKDWPQYGIQNQPFEQIKVN